MTGSAAPAGAFLFARRGLILALLFLALAASRALADAPLRPVALALVAAGMAWRFYAGRHIAGHSNGLRLGEGPLATTGPYAWGRHPLYLSNLAVAAGLLLFANSLPAWAMAALFAGACLHHALLARAEERHLESRHGEAWRRYAAVTPRWLGPPRGRIPAPGTPPEAAAAGAWRRQGGNLATAAAAALVLWGLAR